MLLVIGLILCVLNASSGLYINRAFQTLNSWTQLAEFCFLSTGGLVEYLVQSDVPIPVVLYYSPGQEHITQDNVLDTNEADSSSNTTLGYTEVITSLDQLMGDIQYTPTPLSSNPSDHLTDGENNSNDEGSEGLQPQLHHELEAPCNRQNVQLFRSIKMTGHGNFTVTTDAKDVICLRFAISPGCHQKLHDFKLQLTITNDVDTSWWQHVSADDLFLFLSDLTGFGFVIILCIAAVCIRAHLISHKFYLHALNSCILSMMLLCLALGVNILLHGLFCVDGYDLGNVRVIVHVFYISAQALFVQAIFLDAMKHIWCNDESRLERGYRVSLIISALTVFYGVSLVTIHVYQAFSEEGIISQYAQFSLQGLMWIVFVFMVLCTATSSTAPDKEYPDPKYLTNSLAKCGRQGPPHPPLRSLFGDYDYAINLPAVMEHQALQNATLPTTQCNDDDDDRATNYTDFDHVVTPTPPGEAAVRWVGIDVSGHYTDLGAVRPLGGCAVLVYSCWFVAVPLLSLWSPYLLPPWLTTQYVYALGLLNFLVGYIYFLASCVPCKEDVHVVPEQQETKTVEHLSVV